MPKDPKAVPIYFCCLSEKGDKRENNYQQNHQDLSCLSGAIGNALYLVRK